MADDEKTFLELQERIAKTIAFLESVDPKSTEGVSLTSFSCAWRMTDALQ
jgi:hypothetical protein